MIDWLNTAMSFLMFVTVAPLLALGMFIILDRFAPDLALAILDALMRLVTLQLFVGGLVNIGGGIALAALGVWAAVHFGTILYGLMGVVVVAFGLWRMLRGVGALQAFRKKD